MFDPTTKKLIKTADIQSIKFTYTRKKATGEECLGPGIDYIYEFEVNLNLETPKKQCTMTIGCTNQNQELLLIDQVKSNHKGKV